MKIYKTPYVILAFLLLLNTSTAQITITLSSLPSNTPLKDKIFLAGNFNGWNPSDDNFVFKKTGHYYTFTFTPAKHDVIEFKCTRGSWATVEGDEEGNAISNHAVIYEGKPIDLELEIESWEDLDGKPAVSTASENVSIISEEFFIPQLNRKRRVWIYLPPKYSLGKERYPVLYMHDGQNVFDELTSYAGEWKVDETLDKLYAERGGCIVVAVDNGEQHRMSEYSPWKNDKYGGGEGAAYIEFLVKELKPYIDGNYRTLPKREHTGIMGSSMGGLISLYAGLEYPEVFSRLGVFSPAFWFSDECYAHVEEKGKKLDAKIFLLIGRLEGERYVTGMATMYHVLLNAGFAKEQIFYVLDEKGQHNEPFWARQFPDAFNWLFDISPKENLQSDWPFVEMKKSGKKMKVNISKDLGEVTLEIHCSKKENQTFTFSEKIEFPSRLIGKKTTWLTLTDSKGILFYKKSFNRH